MRSVAVEVAMLALLAVSGGAFGQAPAGAANPPQKPAAAPDKPTTLEEMLAKALKDNPDIQVAKSKLAEADAELNRTRLQVTQKVVTLYRNVEAQKAAVAAAETTLGNAITVQVNKGGGSLEVDRAKVAVILAKAKLAEMEAEMPYLLGQQPKNDLSDPHSARAELLFRAEKLYLDFLESRPADPTKPPVRGDMADRIRKALDTPVTVNYKNQTVPEILKDFQQKMPGVPFLVNVYPSEKDKVDLLLAEPVPLGAAMQAFQDKFGYRFSVREYGILVTAVEIPRDAVPLHTFWKSPPAKKEIRDPEGKKNPPPEQVEGLVKALEADSGLLTISVGSDAGLAEGHTLEVYSLSPAKYKGTVRVLKVSATEAVCKPVGRSLAAIQSGDRVASKIAAGN